MLLESPSHFFNRLSPAEQNYSPTCGESKKGKVMDQWLAKINIQEQTEIVNMNINMEV